MDWWLRLNSMVSFFQDTPALGVHMALHGPDHEKFAARLAYSMNATPVPFEVYPEEGIDFPAPDEGGLL